MSVSESDASSILSDESDIENAILDQPMYYVLSQFLVTDEGKNVATCIQALTKEVKDLKNLLSSFLASQKA